MVALIDLFFQETPLWLFFPITVGLVLLSVAGGVKLGGRIRGRKADETERPAGIIVASNFALLAFILAITFNMTAARFEARKELLLDEVNAISTSFLRADFLPELERAASKALLREYVAIRSGVNARASRLSPTIARSEEIHGELWSQVTDVLDRDRYSAALGLYSQSLNQLMDVHSMRVTVGLQYQIPGVMWLALYFVTMLATAAVGYQFGLSEARSPTMVFALTLSFTVVIVLIADLDRSSEGLLRISQAPLAALQGALDRLD